MNYRKVDFYINNAINQPVSELKNARSIQIQKAFSHCKAPLYYLRSIKNPDYMKGVNPIDLEKLGSWISSN